LLLPGYGLLVVVCRIRLVLLRLRVLSTLRLASLNGVLTFLVGAVRQRTDLREPSRASAFASDVSRYARLRWA
jgi:hypothetical protein